MGENEHGYIQYQHTETELHDTKAVHLERRSQRRGRTVVVHTGMDCFVPDAAFPAAPAKWSSYKMYHVVYDCTTIPLLLEMGELSSRRPTNWECLKPLYT